MKIIKTEYLVKVGAFPNSKEWEKSYQEVSAAIKALAWPKGSTSFMFDPSEKGKKRGEGNGVVPIKKAFCLLLNNAGWELETKIEVAARKKPGPLDATKKIHDGRFIAIEWETGNISSSHRALNKMALGMLRKKIVGGILVLPTREMYQYLTDRIGNFEEIEPYFDLWKSLSIEEGVLAVIAVEHDGLQEGIPRIPKGTDGRAIV